MYGSRDLYDSFKLIGWPATQKNENSMFGIIWQLPVTFGLE